MPCSYAHYRFGNQLLPQLPADIRGSVLRQRPLFQIGLQGPDFLYFHSFFKKTHLYQLGNVYHENSGREFFRRMCAHVKQRPSEAASAYLVGLLGHYCLDSGCHPFVYRQTEDSDFGHAELETEFDRFLMARDGIKKPHETNIFRHMGLKKEDYALIAGFYPELTAKQAAECIRSMALAQQLLTLPTAAGHKTVSLFTRMAGGNAAGKVMTLGPNPNCAHLDGKLLELYDRSRLHFPRLLEQLRRHMDHADPLGDDFKANFNKGE